MVEIVAPMSATRYHQSQQQYWRGSTTADPPQNFAGGLPLGRSVAAKSPDAITRKQALDLKHVEVSNQGCRCWLFVRRGPDVLQRSV
jgi:hypothetical protein